MHEFPKLSCVGAGIVLFAVLITPFSFGDAHIYSKRNECISHETLYEIRYLRSTFEIMESISFRTLSPVKNCYFTAENFTIHRVILYKNKELVKISLSHLENHIMALQLLGGTIMRPSDNFTVVFHASKPIQAVDEGLVFKVYRDQCLMRMNWYSIVKIGPAGCGKLQICINSLHCYQKLTIVAVHPKTHRLFCPGVVEDPQPIDGYPNSMRTVCRHRPAVSVNNMHFAVGDFQTLVYDGVELGHHPHRLSLVAPRDENGYIYSDIIEQFDIIKRIFSMLLLTINLTPFDVIIYALPNGNEMPEPVIQGGVCYFNFEKIHFQLDMQMIYRAYVRCLLYQGMMTHRRSDSWSLLYPSEGLFEKFVSEFEVHSQTNTFYRDAIEGESSGLAALSQVHDDFTKITFARPWRKSAGFFGMLGKIAPKYELASYSDFLHNNGSIMNITYLKYLSWITNHSSRLGMNTSQFLDVIDTWTMSDGYPVIHADVVSNRSVCVDHYTERGAYMRSLILPLRVSHNFPNVIHSQTVWTNPRSSENCVAIPANLYPYLINHGLNVVARVNYDLTNWATWADAMMKYSVRTSLEATQRVTLVTDALFFAGQRKLSYRLALRFLFAMQAEELEEAWRNMDRTLEFLEAKLRYTDVYPLFHKIIATILERFFVASERRVVTSEVAFKWACMMGHPACLEEARTAVDATLRDHRFRQLPEVLCAGMRRLTLKRFRQLIGTMGRPDWREPQFHVEMMICAENWQIQRDLMHHLFFQNSWNFRRKTLFGMVMKSIRRSKAGTDIVVFYLDHDPVGMLRRLGQGYMAKVILELAQYLWENEWFEELSRNLRSRGLFGGELLDTENTVWEILRTNRKWYEMQYKDARHFLVKEFGKYVRKFEEKDSDSVLV